jgi:hypothetical protein
MNGVIKRQQVLNAFACEALSHSFFMTSVSAGHIPSGI